MAEEIPLIINKTAGQKVWFALAFEKLLIRPSSSAKLACGSPEKIQKIVLTSLKKEGLIVRPYFTKSSGDATKIAKDLAKGKERLIIVAGGDGTINEVANGVVGTETCLGIIPLGTANAFAIELGIPLSIEEASRVIREGRTRTVDVGKAGQRFFVMAAGMSFDARVIQRMTPGFKRFFGSFAYILKGVLESLSYSFPTLKVEVEDIPLSHAGYLVIVANARFYGGYFKAAPRALLDDGLLDVLVMKRKRLWNLLTYLVNMRYGNITQLPDVEYFQCRRVKVSTASPVQVHVDAEIAGMTPCEFECIPASLRMIVPKRS